MRALMATLAPSWANASAIARPMPLLEPPMMATRSFNPKSTTDNLPGLIIGISQVFPGAVRLKTQEQRPDYHADFSGTIP